MPGAHATTSKRGLLPWLVVLGLLVVAVPVGDAMLKVRAESDRDSPQQQVCEDVRTVELAVARPILEPVKRAVAAIGANGSGPSCVEVGVDAAASATVLRSYEFGKDTPDLWIPDSRAWLMQLVGDDVPITEVRDAVAGTPVVMVGGPAAHGSASWHVALDSGQVSLPDPLETGVGAMALLAVRPELEAQGRSSAQIYEELVPLAQGYGARRDGRVDAVSVQKLGKGSTRMVAATEQDYLAALAERPGLQAKVPGTGSPLMTFPLYASGEAGPEAREVAEDLARWLESDDGVAALHDANLRSADGVGAENGLGDIARLDIPWQFPQAADLDTWRKLSMPSSVLAVFDASGSMDYVAGSRTRMELAVDVAHTALGIFPDQARIGLWVFSIDQGGPGQDWRQLEAMRRLDAKVAGTTQREVLRRRANQMLDLTAGGTGLYDSTLAAYRQALEDYHPAYSNSVIVLTDGANDDPGSIGLKPLLAKLARLRDPERPVRVIGIAVSGEADYRSLRQVAEATGGAAYRAEDPQDILEVFAQAVSTR